MALVVEDGSGLSNADSYELLTNAVTYATNFGRTSFGALANDAAREVKMRQATQFIDAIYLWPSRPKVATQSLAFPRYHTVIDGTVIVGVPSIVKRACLELATMENVLSLLPDMEVSKYVFRSVKAEGIQKSERFRDSVVPRHYWVAEGILRPLLQGSLIGGATYNKIRRA